MALLLCSAATCQFAAVSGQRNKAAGGGGERDVMKTQEHPILFSSSTLSFFFTTGTDLSLNEGFTAETRVVLGVTGVPGNALLSRAGFTPAATGDDSAPVQVFDPSD